MKTHATRKNLAVETWHRHVSLLKFASLCALYLLLAFFTITRSQAQYRSPGAKAASSASADSQNSAQIALGRKLFFDPRLSSDGWISCSSCHDPGHGFSDPRRFSVGVNAQRTKRHAPTLVGRGSGESQFWDGRAATLEEQVVQPITNPDEMGMSMEALLRQLNRETIYRGLTRESLAGALASYVRSIRSENSRYDLFISGWPMIMSDPELEGLQLFRGKAQCYLCHSGPQFTDERFHNTGIAWHDGSLQDPGRAAITGKPYHQGAFKTPSLRDVANRGPYMHDGSLTTLEDVIEFYDRGGNPNPYLDENIVPLHLSAAEKKALLAFLKTGLTGSLVEGTQKSASQSTTIHKTSSRRSY